MPSWVIPSLLARSTRPGYSGEQSRQVPRAEVDAWITEVRAFGVKSIICLLADDQLGLYGDLPTDLVSYYQDVGFSVCNVPARDHQSPPLSSDQLYRIWAAYQQLPKPVLVHCSAGMDRTGLAVECIVLQLPQETQKLIVCKVELPRFDKGEPDYCTIEVHSVDNAIIKLKTKMNADPQYDWNSARVIEQREKS
jgi:protein-tyrosine phosphatase